MMKQFATEHDILIALNILHQGIYDTSGAVSTDELAKAKTNIYKGKPQPLDRS